MFSMPPATATSMPPSMISCAAETIACAPEPQPRFTVMAGTDPGSPPRIDAWRAGFILVPACTTLPITTVPTCSGASLARARAARIALAPSSGAATSFKLPPNVPMAVRTGSARTTVREGDMTAFSSAGMTDGVSVGGNRPGEPAGHRAARGVERVPLGFVGQRWNGDDLALVETGEGGVDHVLRRHHHLGGKIAERQPALVP